MRLVRLTTVFCLPLIAGQGYAQSGDKKAPNIICILVDDLGYGDLSCQGYANDIRTPNIDILLTNGVRFVNLYANSTVSSPSRAALLTGKYPDLVGVPGVIRTNPDNSWGYLSPDAILLPQVVKKQKYESAIIGKWHLGLEHPNTPNSRGFDYFHGFLGDMMDDYYTHLRQGQNYMRLNNSFIEPVGHATELFTDWAIEYIKKAEQCKQPYFMYLAYNAPHDPVQPPKEWLASVTQREPQANPKRAKLIAFIEHLDDNIGKLYAYLEQTNQLENTVIFFASDNGGVLREGASNGPLRGGKQDMYEGGIRVPGGVYWKNTIQPSVSDNFVLLFDFFSTICDIAGAAIPEHTDGISIFPLLKGESQITNDRTAFWMRREGGLNYGGQIYYAARKGNLKLVQNTPWEKYQFFNLQKDTTEQRPYDKPDKLCNELSNELMKHIQKSGAVKWQNN